MMRKYDNLTGQNTEIRSFPAKILLFGEYTVLAGSDALAIPYPHFTGQLLINNLSNPAGKDVLSFKQYINRHLITLSDILDVERLKKDTNEKGLHFQSGIPQGYGIGSSGAMIAALYYEYELRNWMTREASDLSTIQIDQIQEDLARMEHYFHGKSSGFDPLVSLLNKPIYISQKKGKVVLEKLELPENPHLFFLYNSLIPRKSEPLIEGFMKRTNDASFKETSLKKMMTKTNHCIQFLLKKDWDKLYDNFKQLSVLQEESMQDMIPNLVMDNNWKYGKKTGNYFLKLCGAGGGGFFLGMTNKWEKTQEKLGKSILKIV